MGRNTSPSFDRCPAGCDRGGIDPSSAPAHAPALRRGVRGTLLAEGVRRARADPGTSAGLHRSDAGLRTPDGIPLADNDDPGCHAPRLRNRRAKATTHPGDVVGRGTVGPVSFRTHGRLGPSRRSHPGGPRWRGLRAQRRKGLDRRCTSIRLRVCACVVRTGTPPSTPASRS